MGPKLFMLLLGCKPPGRLTEQHDIFFGVAHSLRELVPAIIESWADAGGKIHIDAWREVNAVDGCKVTIISKVEAISQPNQRLFFLNLGGYKPNDFEEYHYKMLVPAKDMGEAVRKAKSSAFWRHTGFAGAPSHIDDKYGIDVDDMYEIEDILPESVKNQYHIHVREPASETADIIHLGYLTLNKLTAMK